MEVIQRYSESNYHEDYYCCTWGLLTENCHPIVAAGGSLGIIRIFDIYEGKSHCVLQGHGCEVNSLKFHPANDDILFSMASDDMIRMWNVRKQYTICCFEGHLHQVLDGDIHGLGHSFASGGIDNTIRIWDLTSKQVIEAIELSYRHSDTDLEHNPIIINKPFFSTNKVHSNYVDCVRWAGDLLLSKSTVNEIILWKPAPEFGNDNVIILRKYTYSYADLWFIRFDVDYSVQKVITGNRRGEIYIWDIDSSQLLCHYKLTRCRSTVRSVCFNLTGKHFVAICEDGSVWRYDSNEFTN